MADHYDQREANYEASRKITCHRCGFISMDIMRPHTCIAGDLAEAADRTGTPFSISMDKSQPKPLGPTLQEFTPRKPQHAPTPEGYGEIVDSIVFKGHLLVACEGGICYLNKSGRLVKLEIGAAE